jgi:hypothetical protein
MTKENIVLKLCMDLNIKCKKKLIKLIMKFLKEESRV